MATAPSRSPPAGLLDRIVDASSPSVVTAYENRITALEREKLIMAEKLEVQGRPQRLFDEMFELTMRFLSNPCSIWENNSLAHRHAVLKLTFEHRLTYCRDGGFRTPKHS